MKKIITLALITLFTGTIGNAQQRMNREKIDLLKTSYITDVLNLSPAEAEKFWPVYNLYTDKIQNLKRELQNNFRTNLNSDSSIETISEVKAKEILENFIQLEKQIATTEIEMIRALEKVLSAKKTLLLQKAERNFNQRILQEYGQRKKMQGQ
jgi:glycosylphosphatidylinositol transamidase (GPIT) subunit GPI8